MLITKFKIEQAIKKYPLGRRPGEDERRLNFRIKQALKKAVAPLQDSQYHFANGIWIDQVGPSCVGAGFTHWYEDGPTTHPGYIDYLDAYKGAQQNDEWGGEDYDGSSINGVMKWAQKKGLIGEYTWGFTLKELIDLVFRKKKDGGGPCLVGTNWYELMFFPDAKGRIKIGGDIVGGHAYCINGGNQKEKFTRDKNSWGREWGINGHATMSFEDTERLIHEQGEVSFAVELKTK